MSHRGMGKALVLAMATFGGCVDTGDTVDLHEPCKKPDFGHEDAEGNPDPCHLHDPKPAAPDCAGRCLPLPPFGGWEGPALVWSGDAGSVPDCPDSAGSNAYLGYADPEPFNCRACACDAPTGSCGLPTFITASSAKCEDVGASAVHTSFDPPAGWDGSCTTNTTIAANKMCEGKPCVASVTIGPLTLTETTCAVSTLATPKSAGEGMGKWATVAIACQGVVDSDSNHCPTSAEVCSPYAKPPPSFRECIYHEGDVDCPSAYPNKSVFYSDVDDQRSCTPCACEAAQGSECTGDVTLNETNTCAETPLTLSAPLDTSSSQCYPLHTGMALASKSATIITYSPGACAPTGGEVTGTVTPTGPSTFCCLTAP